MARRRVSERRLNFLRCQIHEQRKWIESCGGSQTGYIENYGDPGVSPLEDGEPKIISVRPCDVHLFEGKYEPVPGRLNCFYAMHLGNGGSAIWDADHGRLVGLETEYEILTGKRV